MVKLTKAQEELLRAIQSGVRLRITPTFATRDDTQEICTKQTKVLCKLGLLIITTTQAGWDAELTDQGRAWPQDVPSEEKP